MLVYPLLLKQAAVMQSSFLGSLVVFHATYLVLVDTQHSLNDVWGFPTYEDNVC